MIFVTVGTQLAFDRLIGAVDVWAGLHPEVPLFAQIGPTKAVPRHVPSAAFVSPIRADQLVREADLIVAHAGMGSILTAMQHGRPVLIMPRRATLSEHRNDHQLATARWLTTRPGVTVAWDEQELLGWLDRRSELSSGARLPAVASGPLVEGLHRFIHGNAI